MVRKTTLILLSLLVLLSTGNVSAAGGDITLLKSSANVDSRASLQRGAKYFVNYCLSCHSSKYARYKWIGIDLGLTEEMVKKDLIFTGKRINDLMAVSMQKDKATQWFGAPPPDLTLIARAKGPDWIYTYLKSFYLDSNRPLGVNNLISQGVSMPHVLWEMQGWQKLVESTDDDGNVVKSLEMAKPGTLSESEYNKVVNDLVTFLVYLAEPAILKRYVIGKWVILFLFFFLGISYYLYYEYWRKIH